MKSLPSAYFDALYDRHPDPWGFETSEYEAGKYAATLAALSRPRYRSALEVGCSIGVLTEALAPYCDRLLGIDVAESALKVARERVGHLPHVRLACRSFPGEVAAEVSPDGFDLILLSEVLYYLDASTVTRAARITRAMATPGADVLLVHWLGPTPDYPLTGDAAAQTFIDAIRPHGGVVFQAREPDYRIDLIRL
ncbi:SAM-dependent methyltransferase [Polymorphobacter sp.]|uniref:SAM-dependent methyltransferase n=1 Tax=Polymorphobacter sp. TaxID=1909290 RepID=UPI003F6E8363